MTQIKSELRKSAANLVREFGESATLRSVVIGAYDATLGKTPKTYVNQSVTAVVVQFKKGETETGVVSKEERKAYVASPVQLSPKHEDLLVFASQTVKVTRVLDVLEGTGGGLLYILSVRG